jgi:hypothetical protein
VLVAAVAAYVIEFFADKIPWVDTIWDSFHTFIRPLGAVLMAAAVLGPIDPVLKLVTIILCGGVAFASHSSKMSTRLIVNHSPEPFTNIAISLVEDVFALVGTWVALVHPIVSLALVLIFVAIFLWLMPKVFRRVRLQISALHTWMTRDKGRKNLNVNSNYFATQQPEFTAALYVVATHALPVPEQYARQFSMATGQNATPYGVRVAATKSISGLGQSIGYLILGQDNLTFVAKRSFRHRVHRIEFREVLHARWKRGLLMDRLVLSTHSGEKSFYVFKDVDTKVGEYLALKSYS